MVTYFLIGWLEELYSQTKKKKAHHRNAEYDKIKNKKTVLDLVVVGESTKKKEMMMTGKGRFLR